MRYVNYLTNTLKNKILRDIDFFVLIVGCFVGGLFRCDDVISRPGTHRGFLLPGTLFTWSARRKHERFHNSGT